MTSDWCYSSSWYSKPSSDGKFIASVYKHNLIIRSASKNNILHRFPLPSNTVSSQWRFLQWFHGENVTPSHMGVSRKSNRVLLADNDIVLFWDIEDPQWRAEIHGAASNLGPFSHVQFGYNADEVLIFSAFCVKTTIWSLLTRRGVEIRDPKNISSCCDHRPRTGHLAILIRAAAHDALHLLAPRNQELVTNVELTTVDAQGLKWSPDGRWIVIWDAASYGYKIFIYTADGNLYKTFSGGQGSEDIGLGIMTVNWSPLGNFLTIGDFNQRVTLLSINTFSPVVSLEHPSTINFPHSPVWQEQINASGDRSYLISSQPTCPPVHDLVADSPCGVSILEYNKDGGLLATKNDYNPTTIWIWHLKSMSAATVLIHHSPIRRIQWHPLINDLLLIHCSVTEPVIHLWKDSWEVPKVISLRLDRRSKKMEASWLSDSDGLSSFMLTSLHNFAIGRINKEGELITMSGKTEVGAGPEEMFDEGNSLDLLPLKESQDDMATDIQNRSPGNEHLDQWTAPDEADDTFEYRRQRKASI